MISKKIILTKKELSDIISKAYLDGFEYSDEKDETFKKYGDSQGKDVYSYTEKKIEEILKTE